MGGKEIKTDDEWRESFAIAEAEQEPIQERPAIGIAEAFAVIAEALKNGHRFSFEQMDLGIELSLVGLPPNEQLWLREIAKNNNVPLWQAMLAQFVRNNENGLANSLILNPSWRSGEVVELTEIVCPTCEKPFRPERWGQIYDTGKCGAEAERKALGLPPPEALPARTEQPERPDEKKETPLIGALGL